MGWFDDVDGEFERGASTDPNRWRTMADVGGAPPPVTPVQVAQAASPTPAPVAPGNQSWQSTPQGQALFNNLQSTFPDMSAEEVWAHLNYPQMPDSQFMRAIIGNLRQQRPQVQQAPQTAQAEAPTAPAGNPALSGNFAEFGRAWLASGGRTVTDLANFIKAHPEYGATIFNQKGNKVSIGGRVFDAVIASGNQGGQGASWDDETDKGAGGAAFGSALAPFEQSFNAPRFVPPPNFVAPTGKDVLGDPGFQFRMDEGLKALQRSKAAQGTLRTGGTAKELMNFAQDLGSQEYSNVYNRRLGEYESRYGKAASEHDRTYGQQRSEFDLGRDIFQQNQDRPFGKLLNLAGLGNVSSPSYAGQYGNLLMGGAVAQGDYLTQGANASAAGQVGSANAWNSGLGSLANLGIDMASLWRTPGGAIRSSGPWASGYRY